MSMDGILTKLVTFDGESYNYLLRDHLINMTTAIERYNIPNVYLLQFAVDRYNLQPIPILLSINNNMELVKGSLTSDKLQNIISNSINESINPTIMVFPKTIQLRHLIFGGVPHAFTPFYLVVSKTFKEKIKNESINSVHIFSNIKRDLYVVRLGKGEEIIDDAGDDLVLVNSVAAYPLRLPFINFAYTMNPDYLSIIKTLSFIPSESFEKNECTEIFNYFKTSNVFKTPLQNINIYKDFIKICPTSMDVYHSITNLKNSEDKLLPVMNVALHLTYTTQKIQYLVIYRYLITN